LTHILQSYQEAYPQLVRLESIGQSYEGRDIWLVTVTNFDTGPDTEKPALWIDGNIHASEVSPSTACLYHLHTLVTQYGTDPDITRCLDSRVFYICPRVNPDGAEWALADKPKIIRSSTRPYPYDEDPLDGLAEEDIDGDGRMLMMRIPDPNGPWKVYDQEPRLLVPREPTETGGQYYRLLPEGPVKDYDGVTIQMQPVKQRLDINRNFPADWRGEKDQSGAGPYPVSEPEVRAIVDFIAQHRNIIAGIAFHTYSGVLLRPYSHKSDDEFPAEDLWTFKKIGAKGTELTGYPNISIYHDFRYHPRSVITGGMDAWMYDHVGVFFWGIEIWSPQKQAGIEEYKFIDWYREHDLEDDLKMLKWSDAALEGQGYVEWYEFDHPQLGKVELGGWNSHYAFRNPPPKYMEAEMALFPEWFVWHLLISPLLEIYETRVTPLGNDVYQIRLVVQNTGWLPTYVTKKALEQKLVRGVICEITLPEGAALQSGKAREEIGQLEGRAYKPSAPIRFSPSWASDTTADRAKVEWVVRAPQGGTVKLIAHHDRAGVVRTELTL
jgi:murein tripeptide amidase MpaA